MNIRGMASNGPFAVIASNFAPGTTARDVESAMAPIGQDILGCVLLADVPTVIAELVFAKREGAENVIATFNNQRVRGLSRRPFPAGQCIMCEMLTLRVQT